MLEGVIIGGGFSSTIAAVILAKAGYRIALAARCPVYPEDFRAERLDQVQADALSWMQLLDWVVSDIPSVRHVALASHGRLPDLWPTINDGIRYDMMANAMCALLLPCVELVIGRVFDL